MEADQGVSLWSQMEFHVIEARKEGGSVAATAAANDAKFLAANEANNEKVYVTCTAVYVAVASTIASKRIEAKAFVLPTAEESDANRILAARDRSVVGTFAKHTQTKP